MGLVASKSCPSVERFFLTFQVMTTLLLQAMYEPYLLNPLLTVVLCNSFHRFLPHSHAFYCMCHRNINICMNLLHDFLFHKKNEMNE